jgi:hypothetical protein
MHAVGVLLRLLTQIAKALVEEGNQFLSSARASKRIFEEIISWDYDGTGTNFVRAIWGEGWNVSDYDRVKTLDQRKVDFSSMRSQSLRK